MAECTCGMVIDILNIYLPESKLSQLLGVSCSIMCLLNIDGIALFHLLHHLNRLLLVQSIGQVTVGNTSHNRIGASRCETSKNNHQYNAECAVFPVPFTQQTHNRWEIES